MTRSVTASIWPPAAKMTSRPILSQIQGVLPAVNVLFEFGRQGAIFGQPNIEAFRLLDIAHHTRL